MPVEAHGRERCWLVHFTSARPDAVQPIQLERAAGVRAMRILLDDEIVTMNVERRLLADLLAGRLCNAEPTHARTAALGHPTRDRHYLPITVIAENSNGLRSLLARPVHDAEKGRVGRTVVESR